MLVSRILRALLAGAEPQEILAITFTRKAAGEMRERLHGWLRDFALSAFTERPEVAHIETRLIFEFRRSAEMPVYLRQQG